MMMKELIICVVTVLLGGVTAQYQDRRQQVCIYGANRYRHGELVTLPRSPCARFRCEYNTLRLIDQDCVDRKGNCVRVGQSWTDACVTYRCTTRKINNKQHYQGRITELRCTDSRGACHRSGTPFQFRIGSRTYPSCTCRIWQEGQRQRIKYFC